MALTYALFGPVGIAAQPLLATIKNILKKPAKELAKLWFKETVGSTISEMATGAGQAWVDQREGLKGPTPTEGAIQSIIPAVTTSLILGPAFMSYNRVQARTLMQNLNAEDIETRVKAAQQVSGLIAENTKDESLASTWIQGASDVIQKGEKFSFDERLVDFASRKMAEDIGAEPPPIEPIVDQPIKARPLDLTEINEGLPQAPELPEPLDITPILKAATVDEAIEKDYVNEYFWTCIKTEIDGDAIVNIPVFYRSDIWDRYHAEKIPADENNEFESFFIDVRRK
jgi:hypothetical protein